MKYIFVFIVLILMSLGQILFKKSANSIGISGKYLNDFLKIDFILSFGAAIIVYFSATVFWVLILKDFELNKAYPIMALSYLLVPIASFFIFGEKLSITQVFGLLLIIVGVSIAAK